MNLGNKLKELRKQRNITIKELSSMTGLSIGFISNLERNQNSPSISNLQLICQALEINIVNILDPATEKSTIVTRKNDRNKMFTKEISPINYELIVPAHSELNGICIIIEANSEFSKISWGHNTDEVGLITKGSMEIHLDENIFLLSEGDSIYIPKNTPHNYRNPSNEPSESYWFSIKR